MQQLYTFFKKSVDLKKQPCYSISVTLNQHIAGVRSTGMIKTLSNIRLNLSNFYRLQGEMTEIEMARKLNVSRSQLWRIKKKSSAVGQEFIMKFKKAYPNEPFEDYFFVETVELNQQVE
jgi:hypothetical protein